MKYRWIFLLAITAVVALSAVASGTEPERNRYHQHLEAAEKAPCTDHDESVFCTHLPLMEVTTDGPIPPSHLKYDDTGHGSTSDRNYEMVAATVRYFDSETENNHLTDRPVVEERALFRIRGASSRNMDKKNYLLKFTEEDMVTGLDVSLSGMVADNSWALHGPFWDKSLIRNYVCMNLAGEIMDYAPNVRFCELFVNGEYMGLYLLMEKVGYNKNGRLNISKTDPGLATSYVIKIDRESLDPFYALETFRSLSRGGTKQTTGYMTVVYPETTLTQVQKDYITMDISRFEKAMYSFDYNDPAKGYRQYIDVQSFIDFYLINEFTLNYDAPALSTYLYKDMRGKLKMCVWDFDAAFDYYQWSSISPETFLIQKETWFEYLFKDPAFVGQVEARYLELREKYFSEEYLFSYIDDVVEYLGPAIDRNYEKWGYSFQSTYNGKNYDFLVPAERNVRSHEEAIQQMRAAITDRIDHMDNNLDRLYTLCHQSLNKRFNLIQEGDS